MMAAISFASARASSVAVRRAITASRQCTFICGADVLDPALHVAVAARAALGALNPDVTVAARVERLSGQGGGRAPVRRTERRRVILGPLATATAELH